MHYENDIQDIDRVERLINRRLDRQNSPAEEAELDQHLAASESARAMLAEYVRNDLFATQALRADAAQITPASSRHSSGWRLTIAAAVLSAAAVIAISFVPDLWKAAAPIDRVAIHNKSAAPLVTQPPATRFVDYNPSDYIPRQRQRDLQRDVIGVQSDDPNVIFVFERNTLTNRLVPITGDF